MMGGAHVRDTDAETITSPHSETMPVGKAAAGLQPGPPQCYGRNMLFSAKYASLAQPGSLPGLLLALLRPQAQ